MKPRTDSQPYAGCTPMTADMRSVLNKAETHEMWRLYREIRKPWNMEQLEYLVTSWNTLAVIAECRLP